MGLILQPLMAISRHYSHIRRKYMYRFPASKVCHFVHSAANSRTPEETQQDPVGETAAEVQNILSFYRNSPKRKIELALDYAHLTWTEDLVFNVLKRHRSDWKPAFFFFNWVSKFGQVSLGSSVYNEILDILGEMRRFLELTQVLDEMRKSNGLLDAETYRVLVNRYAAAHKVEEAIGVFNERREMGLEDDLDAFRKLLIALCRHKHVDVAETLLRSKGFEFGMDIKAMNIVLNGWCVRGNVREAKRFWRDILASGCKPDVFTYATFMNALCKKGKIGTAMKLYRAMWEERQEQDVVICNCLIDALCFKKRVPMALVVFREMKERGCLPNSATYNSLIKHFCKICRMEKVYELLEEMEEKKGSCMPDEVTFNYLLKALKKPEEVPGVLEMMKRCGCKMSRDTYNLILKLYVDWNCEEKVKSTWDEMEKYGLGPDQRSYTIMIHWHFDKGRIEEALQSFGEMTSRGMVTEPRTEILVNDMKMTLRKKNASEKERNVRVTFNKSSSPTDEKRRKVNFR